MLYNKINLQLFAVQTTVTANTGNDLSPEMKTFYDMTLIDEASANLVHDQFGQKRPIPANGGKTIEFRKFSSLAPATLPITEGVTPNGNRLNVTAITATVDQYGDFITQSDVLELTALDNTILEATKLLGKQAGLTLDIIVRNKLAEGTNVIYSSKVGADGTETAVTKRADLDTTCQLRVKDIQKAVATLRGQNAPTIGGKYVAIIHPYVAYDLMRDPEWIDAHKYANPTNLYEGEIGEVAGVRFVQTTQAKVFGNGSLGTFSTLILGEGAYGVTEVTGGGLQTIVKQKGSAGTADPLDQRSSVGWKAMKTAEILVNAYMVRIESMSAEWSSVLLMGN
jgi:N4-gp56 family major capsid protein